MSRIDLQVPGDKKVYFASDFHLGIPDRLSSLEREKVIVKWLDQISLDAAAIFLLGDIFDFWFEYRHVVPRGYTRLLGKISSLTDAGIPVYVFTGNHDMWMFGYLEEECGAKIYRSPVGLDCLGKKLWIGHGDGLGPGDYTYKMLKVIFRNPVAQWIFARFHPNFSFMIANFWSGRSRLSNKAHEEEFLGDREWILQYCREMEEKQHHDYYIFGHRHLSLEMSVSTDSMYFNLGEWIHDKKYAELSTSGLTLLQFSG
ncbi:MAG: UDP-2,3-diacylglucosamine diphosphatase [Cyclobacteriaceae bacterium]|nr:UDP-2,3-diacylglucosamine diphosphatase [Cyclobacteriaceae bacterium]